MENFSYSGAFKLLEEKKTIKESSNRLGAALLGLFAIMIGWSFIYFRICGLIGLSTDGALRLTKQPVVSMLLQVCISLAMMMIPFLIYCRACLMRARDIISFEKPTGKVLPVIIGGIGFCLFSSVATDAAASFFEFFNYNPPEVTFESANGFFGVVLTFISCAVMPALAEEFAMRGIVLGSMRKFGDGFAIIVSSLIFGFMHASVYQIPFAFLDGILLGYIVIKTSSIWPAVIIHFLNNAISVIFDYLSKAVSAEAVNLIYLAVTVIFFILLIVCICIIQKKNSEFFKLKTAQTVAGEKKKLGWFLGSPVVIISFIVSLGIAFFLT